MQIEFLFQSFVAFISMCVSLKTNYMLVCSLQVTNNKLVTQMLLNFTWRNTNDSSSTTQIFVQSYALENNHVLVNYIYNLNHREDQVFSLHDYTFLCNTMNNLNKHLILMLAFTSS